MADWGIFAGSNRYQGQAITNATPGVNAKGTWAQVTASTPFNSCGVVVQWRGNAGAPYYALIDIGIGASGSELVIVPNIAGGNVSNTDDIWNQPIIFHCEIPAGTRVAVRAAASSSSTTQISIGFVAAAFDSLPALSLITDYGSSVGSSRGTLVTMPGSGTGSWAQITASTSSAMRMMGIMITSNTTTNGIEFKLDIGIGAAGSEQVVLSQLSFLGRPSTRGVFPQHLFWLPVDIPAGTRLAARFTFIGGTVSNFYVSIMGAS